MQLSASKRSSGVAGGSGTNENNMAIYEVNYGDFYCIPGNLKTFVNSEAYKCNFLIRNDISILNIFILDRLKIIQEMQ